MSNNAHILFRIICGVGELWYDRQQEENRQNIFVTTLKGKNSTTLLESYEDFASQVKCDKGVIEKIKSSGLTDQEKIFKLKDQIKYRVKNWNSWLILVTDVEDLTTILRLLPQPDANDWKNGQLLIATSDVASLPPDDGYHKTISWKKH